jgi:hypothetical protein
MSKFIDFLKANKQDIKIGKWNVGHIPRASFPMSSAKPKAYKFEPSYSWRILTFSCLGHKCRILILLNEEKNNFRASFGVDLDGDTALMCDHEFHSSHPGWHCHLEMSDLSDIQAGSNRANKNRWPKLRSKHSKKEFGITRDNAHQYVMKRFCIDSKGSLL